MERREITFDLEEGLCRELEELARGKGISAEQLVVEILETLVADEDYAQARRRALAHLDEGYDLGLPSDTPREDLHRPL